MLKREIIFWISFILVLIGFFTLLSASMTYLEEPEKFSKIILVQGISIILGFSFILFVFKTKLINYLTIQKYSFLFLVLALILQFLVLSPLGVERNFSTRWLDLGFIVIQPSEIFRFAFILFYAKLLYSFKKEINDNKTFAWFFSVLIILSLFYFYVKDLGSLMILFASVSSMFLFTKAIKKYFLVLFIFSLLGLPMIYFSSHAKKRFITYYNVYFAPEKLDVRGDYYQPYNLIKAVGAGGLWGVGYGGSIQKIDKRLPESVSDSIFAIFAEEWGFVFSVILILIYFWLVYLIFSEAQRVRNFYQKIVIVGLAVNIFFPAYYNILAVLGLVPLSGIPLTFLSKGGTSILMSLVSLGIILLFLPKK